MENINNSKKNNKSKKKIQDIKNIQSSKNNKNSENIDITSEENKKNKTNKEINSIKKGNSNKIDSSNDLFSNESGEKNNIKNKREKTSNRFKKSTSIGKSKNLIYLLSFLLVITIIIFFLLSKQFSYKKYGAQNLPFEIENILVVSTATGDKLENNEKDNNTKESANNNTKNNNGNNNKNNKKQNNDRINIKQVNDVYLKLKVKDNFNIKNNNRLKIKSISINNFKVISKPNKGELQVLKPTGDLNNLFTSSKENLINSSLDFKGNIVDDFSKLQINNSGGTIAFRIQNDLGVFELPKDQNVYYDARLLHNNFKNVDDLKFELSFDLEIKLLNNQTFYTTIVIKKPNIEILNNNKLVKYENEKEYIFKLK